MHRSYWPTLLIALAFYIAPQPLGAQQAEPLFNANVLAMGGAARAIPLEVSNIQLNPGALVLGNRYAVEATGGIRGDRQGGFGRLAITDSLTSPRAAAGVSYDIGWRPASVDRGWVIVGEEQEASFFEGEGTRDLTVALAGELAEDRVGLGASFKTMRAQIQGEEPRREVSADLGLFTRPLEILSLGLVANNIIPVDDPAHPTSLAAAASVFVHPQILLASDVVMNLKTGDGAQPGLHVGMATNAADFMPVRLGYYTQVEIDDGGEGDDAARRAHFMTVGLGLSSAQAGISYALRVQVDSLGAGGEISPFYHVLSIQLTMGGESISPR